MRIPFWTPAQGQRDPALVAAIEQRRGGRLLNLDRMLLWSEPLARSWNVFLRTLRHELSLAPKLRELAICVVARATGADYEFDHHAPEFEAGGSPVLVAALDDPTRLRSARCSMRWNKRDPLRAASTVRSRFPMLLETRRGAHRPGSSSLPRSSRVQHGG
jgi:alkylhydroperoxidase family enzyme